MKRLLFALLLAAACKRGETAPAPVGDADRGRELLVQYGCNACHVIPGTSGVQGSLGPSLAGIASRPAISFGMVPNTPANLTRFIANPPAVNPQTSMPALNMPPQDAQDIAAFLLTLK